MLEKKFVFIHQPDFLPWKGFFKKLKKSQLFVVLDDVKFNRRGWTNRDKILINSKPTWITIPVQNKGNYNEIIKNIKIDYKNNWTSKLFKILEHNYRKAPCFDSHYEFIKKIISDEHEYLIDLNMKLIKYVMNYFNIKNDTIFSSNLFIKEKKGFKILEILKQTNATNYITGIGSKDYLDENLLSQNNIKTEYLKNNNNLDDNLSILHYLFNSNKKDLNV
jgi:hypothetical protein